MKIRFDTPVATTALLFCAAALFVTVVPANASLIAEWNFDNSTLANTGSSGAVHDGTAVGTVTYAASTLFGGTGNALDVSAASSLMRVNNSASGNAGYVNTFDTLTNFSISLWVKGAADDPGTSADAWSGIASKGDQTASGWVIRKSGNSNNARGDIDSDAVNNIGTAFDGNWHHIVMTMNSSATVNYYFDNGTPSTDSVTYSAISSLPMLFGAQDSSGTRSLFGQLDEIKFYDTVLSASEVNSLYTLNTAVPEPTTVGILLGFFGSLFMFRRRRSLD